MGKLAQKTELEGSAGHLVAFRKTEDTRCSLEPLGWKNDRYRNPYELVGPSKEHQLHGHGRVHGYRHQKSLDGVVEGFPATEVGLHVAEQAGRTELEVRGPVAVVDHIVLAEAVHTHAGHSLDNSLAPSDVVVADSAFAEDRCRAKLVVLNNQMVEAPEVRWLAGRMLELVCRCTLAEESMA